MQIEQIGLSELEQRAEELKLTLPIEQTHQWASYQAAQSLALCSLRR